MAIERFQTYRKNQFVDFLKRNNGDDSVIRNLELLPDTINYMGSAYDFRVIVTPYGIDEALNNYEMNYYSEYLVENLFDPKVFLDVRLSISALMNELSKFKQRNGLV